MFGVECLVLRLLSVKYFNVEGFGMRVDRCRERGGGRGGGGPCVVCSIQCV